MSHPTARSAQRRSAASPRRTRQDLPNNLAAPDVKANGSTNSASSSRRRSSSRHPDAARPIIRSRLVTLWTHDPPNFSTNEIVLSPEILAPFGTLGENDLLQVSLPPGVEPKDPYDGNAAGLDPEHAHRHARARKKLRKSMASRTFVFKTAQGLPEGEAVSRSGQLQLSLSRSIAAVYGFYHRGEVVLSKVSRTANSISHLELYFRDQYVGRADMWRLAMMLEDTCVYVGQKITLSGNVRATVGRIFINEHKVTSGYVAPETKTIFRSESAKYHLFIQLSSEMWDFDEDGELYYEKAITGFLPELLRRWRNVPTNHVLSVILFSRVWYDESDLHMLDEASLPVLREQDGRERYYIDYYKVIVDLESHSDWKEVISMLKEEFFRFQHDILLIGRPVAGPASAPEREEQHADLLRRDRALLAGRVSAAHEGNVLEAINLALNPMDDHYIDRDLNRTGLDVVIVTAGTGHFRVNKDLLRLTTERMIDNGIGIDLVCLTKMPLHSVPLFHFVSQIPTDPPANRGGGRKGGISAVNASQRPLGSSAPPDPLYFDAAPRGSRDVTGSYGGKSDAPSSPPTMEFYSIPHWVDASFYNLQQDQPFRADRFVPRVKMREIQQIGYMENEISDISLPYLDLTRVPGYRSTVGLSSSLGASAAGAKGSAGDRVGSAGTGPLEGIASREQRRALRERFDRETFRDLETAPISVRSTALVATGGALVGRTRSATPQGAQFASGSRISGGASFDSPRSAAGPWDTAQTPKVPTRVSRFGRPALASHAEDEDSYEHDKTTEAGPSQPRTPRSREWSRQRPLSMFGTISDTPNTRSPALSSTVSMQNLLTASTSGQFEPSPSSRAPSIRSVATSNRPHARPLQPLGKAQAFVAPLQAQDLVSHLSTQDAGTSATAPASPAHEAATFALNQQRSVSGSGRPGIRGKGSTRSYKLNAGWLWNSLTAAASGSSPKVSSDTRATLGNEGTSSEAITPASSPNQANTSAASLRIKALLQGATSPTKDKGRSLAKQSTAAPTASRHARPKLPFEMLQSAQAADEGAIDTAEATPNPISIPSHAHPATASSAHRGPTGRSESAAAPTAADAALQREQEEYEQALEDEEAQARYAQRAQVEKQTLVNPSNPKKSLAAGNGSSQLLRWQHLFPRRLNRHVVKWRSITTPACLPLTTFYLPTEQELMDHWAEYPHTLSVGSDLSSFLVKRSSSTAPALAALLEMTSQRLAQGYQFIVPMKQIGRGGGDAIGTSASGGPAQGHNSEDSTNSRAQSSRRFGTHGRGSSNSFQLRYPSELFQPGTLASGNPILLGMSNQIHRLSYDRAAGAINVERYIRKMPYDTSPIAYKCCIWPRHLPGYSTVKTVFRYPDFGSYNWTHLDALITGHAEEEKFTEELRYWRTRFVIVPTEGRPPPMIAPTGETLSDEEIRLIGMDRLADQFARARWKGRGSAARQGLSTALLRFIPTSLDPSMSMHDDNFMRQMEAAIVEDEQLEEAMQQAKAASHGKRQLKDATLDSVALALHDEKHGLKIEDRLWNRRTYRLVFTGTSLTTWLIAEYADVRSREEAVEAGDRLMREGLFEHVNRLHGFLDGHYFYRLKGEFAKRAPSASGVIDRRSNGVDDITGNTSGKAHKLSNGTQRSTSGPTATTRGSGNGGGKDADRRAGPSATTGCRRVKMSRSLIIDVDPGRKSDRAETAYLHYDISHNPSNGFNAQLHWLGTTSRFIEDAVQNWTRVLERHGLRLIEAPIGQICDVQKHNPFQAAVPIHLSLRPPELATYAGLLPTKVNPREYFEWAILRRFGFVLDQEAADRYPEDVVSVYESRPNVFEYSQFVHRSGVAFVQVVGGVEGFLWLNNRLFNSHVAASGAGGVGGLGGGGSGMMRAGWRGGGGGGGGGAVGSRQHSQTAQGRASSGRPIGNNINGGNGNGGGVGLDGEEGQSPGPRSGSGPGSGPLLPPDPDRTRREFESFCADPMALHDFYCEVLDSLQQQQQSQTLQSQHIGSTTSPLATTTTAGDAPTGAHGANGNGNGDDEDSVRVTDGSHAAAAALAGGAVDDIARYADPSSANRDTI